MKKKVSFLLTFCMICTFLFPIPIVQAAGNKTVHLKENKVYHYDLNGDKKKESIKVTCNVTGDHDLKIQINVNGKKIFSRKGMHMRQIFIWLT